MIDTRFYKDPNPISVDKIVSLIGGEKFRGSGSLVIRSVAPADRVESGGLCFVQTKASAEAVKDEKGVVCLVTPDFAKDLGKNIAVIVTPEPKRAFGVVIKAMFSNEDFHPAIHPSASIAENADIGDGCKIDAGVVIEEGAVIGQSCHIKAGVFIGRGCVVGDCCIIEANATLSFTIMGDHNHVGPGCHFGATGFGVGMDDGHMIIPHLGRVIIGSNSDFGAGTCIDRGFLDDTKIGDNVMCDNLVHIGHNCNIGDGNIICGQAGISGSVTMGHNNILGGNVGIADHVTIGSDNVFLARTGITKSVGDGQMMAGFPAVPVQDYRREVATLRRLAARRKSS